MKYFPNRTVVIPAATIPTIIFSIARLKVISNQNKNAIINNATYITTNCVSGECFELDGINDSITVVNSNYNEEKGSVSMWFKPNRYHSAVLFSQYNGDLNRLSFSLVGNNLSLYGGHASTAYVSFATSNFTNDTAWRHAVMTYDYTEDIFKLYVDGVLIGNRTTPINPVDNDGRLVFGAAFDYDFAPTYYFNYFNGSIDEVAIYSKVLTQNEVLALYNLEKAKFYEEILSIGVKEINISNCNLTRGEKYNLVAFTNNQKIEQSLIAK